MVSSPFFLLPDNLVIDQVYVLYAVLAGLALPYSNGMVRIMSTD